MHDLPLQKKVAGRVVRPVVILAQTSLPLPLVARRERCFEYGEWAGKMSSDRIRMQNQHALYPVGR